MTQPNNIGYKVQSDHKIWDNKVSNDNLGNGDYFTL